MYCSYTLLEIDKHDAVVTFLGRAGCIIRPGQALLRSYRMRSVMDQGVVWKRYYVPPHSPLRVAYPTVII